MLSPRSVVIVALLCIAAPHPARTCDCGHAGGFLAVAPTTEVVIRGRVVAQGGWSRRGTAPGWVDVVVEDTLRGTVRTKKVRVLGDTGNLCRPYVDRFTVGTTWLFALGKSVDSDATMRDGPLPKDIEARALSVCGDYHAQVQGKTVLLTPKIRRPLEEVVKRFRPTSIGNP